jgi:phospholipase C
MLLLSAELRQQQGFDAYSGFRCSRRSFRPCMATSNFARGGSLHWFWRRVAEQPHRPLRGRASEFATDAANGTLPQVALIESGYAESAQDEHPLNPRVPLMVISPFTKPGYVSHTPADFTALLKFIETRFGSADDSAVRVDAVAYNRKECQSLNVRPFFSISTECW